MRRYAYEALLTHAVWFAILFVFSKGTELPFATWLESFYQWDSRWYGSIALDGHGFLPQSYAFPPLHGWLLGRATDVAYVFSRPFSLTWVSTFYFVSAFLSTTAFIVGNSIFVYLSERRWAFDRRRLWIFAAANPVGYFALTAYSDMMFYALAMTTILLISWTSDRRAAWKLHELSDRQQRFMRIGLIAALFVAPWLRLTGYAFATLGFLKRREALATIAAGILFLIYNWIRTGDPLFFLFVQPVFQMPEGSFIKGLRTSLGITYHALSGDLFRGADFTMYCLNFGILPILALAFSLGLAVWLARQKEYALCFFVTATVFISHNQALWRSTVRYALPLYPMMYWPLMYRPMMYRPITNGIVSRSPSVRRRILFALSVGAGLAIQLFYGRLFQQGGWAF